MSSATIAPDRFDGVPADTFGAYDSPLAASPSLAMQRRMLWMHFAAAAIAAKDQMFREKADYALEVMERRFPEMQDHGSAAAPACPVACSGCPAAAADTPIEPPGPTCWHCAKPIDYPDAVCNACGQHNPAPRST